MKIKLKKAKTVKKMFRGQELEIEPYIPLEYKEFILQKAYESYLVRLEESGGLIEAIAGVDARSGFAVCDSIFCLEMIFLIWWKQDHGIALYMQVDVIF